MPRVTGLAVRLLQDAQMQAPPKWRLGCQRDDCDLLTPMSFNWVA
jgi:hypothetical protein